MCRLPFQYPIPALHLWPELHSPRPPPDWRLGGHQQMDHGDEVAGGTWWDELAFRSLHVSVYLTCLDAHDAYMGAIIECLVTGPPGLPSTEP